MAYLEEITGNKGGKKGGGGTSADNTIVSNATVRIVEAISEGPILGLVRGGKSVYLDETPIKNADDTFNFNNVKLQQRLGNPDDAHLKGHASVETVNSVEQEVKASTGPVTRTITDQNADAVRVIVRINSLFIVDKKGAAQVADLDYRIEIRPFGGVYETAVLQELRGEKTTAPVQMAHKIDLPVGGHPWDIRVTRITEDDTDDKKQRSMSFESFVTLVEGRFTYPHTALIAAEFDAESIGQSVPQRAYHVKGRVISVPSNYGPVNRTYTGIWDGTFKQSYTNNPAWIFNDILENDRYGLGEFIKPSEIAGLKWQLYTIAQYCDQLVPSGFKNDLNEDIMEPRFTFNGVIRNRQEAYNVLQSITAAFRGMGYWALGQVFATADMPADPVKLVTPANVIGGNFRYSSTALKARHSVAIIRWNDPNDFYRPASEIVINNEALVKYGWREKRLDFLGCTSRGLAHRYGKWILDVENNETETVEYKAGFDHMDILPGDIISVADPRKASVRMGGRIVAHRTYSATHDEVEFDSPAEFIPTPENKHKLWLTLPSGELVSAWIDLLSGDGRFVRIDKQPVLADPNSVFVVTAEDVVPAQYRVISINESEENIFQITALQHDPNKYARVEQGISFAPLPYSKEAKVSPVKSVSAAEIAYIDADGLPKTRVKLSWKAPRGVVVREYIIQAYTPTEPRKFIGSTKNTTFDAEGLEPGEHVFYITAVDRKGFVSQPFLIPHVVSGTAPLSNGSVSNLQLVDSNGSTEFFGRDVTIEWKNLFPSTTDGLPLEAVTALYDYNTVKVYDQSTNTLLRTTQVRGETFTYTFDHNKRDCAAATLSVNATRFLRFEVSVTSKRALTSTDAILTVSNPVPDAVLPDVNVNGQEITVAMPSTGDSDVRGMKVWIETATGFNPLTTTPKFNGNSAFMNWRGAPETTYYVRAGYYDFFDDTVSVSAEVSVSTDEIALPVNPAVPTGLALSTVLRPDGKARVTATWNANPESDVIYYELLISENGGNAVSFTSSTLTKFWDVTPGTAVQVSVRAHRALAQSGYSATVSITAATDSVAPAVPASPSAVGTFEAIWLKWTGNTEQDFARYEIFQSNTSTPAPTAASVATFTATTPQFIVQNLTAGETRHYWVRAVDTSGNKSAWSTRVFATARKTSDIIITEALEGLIDATSFAAGVEPVSIVTALPTVKTTEAVSFGGKLYRWNGTEYVASVSAADVTGQLTSAQIADIAAAKITGTITAPQIANGAITDAKIAGLSASKVTGQLTDAQIAAVAAAKLTGTITAPQIDNGAITDAKIAGMAASKVTGQLTDAQVANIAAAKVTGQIVSAQIADAALTISKFASGIRPVEIVSTLPTTGNFVGRVVILETDGKIYRHLGTPTGSAGFVASVSSSDISGQITAAQIAALEASKITGQLTDAQIAALSTAKLTGTITAPQIANGAITDAKIAGLAASKVTGQLTDTQIAQVGAAKIAGQLSDSQIGDLNASKLTGSINEARISAVNASKVTGQLSDAQIAAVNATKIAGQITTVQISDDAISAPKIGAGAVTATAIAAGAIVAGKIAADAITTATISSGAITGAKIAAGVITAEKLTIGNFSNFCDNPNFEIKDESGALVGWFPSSEFVLVNDPLQAYKGSHFVERSVADGSSRAFRNVNSFDVQEGDVYYLSCRIEGNAVCSWSGIRLTLIDANNGVISTVNIGYSPAHIPANHTGWQLVEGRVTIPSGSVKARIELVVIGQTSGTIRWDDILCARANDGRLIVDGIITAEKIAAATITSAQIAANTITASNILAGTITGDRLSANTITAEKIAAGTITSAQIAAGTIQASNIAAGTILASNIAAGTITGDKVAANAITATQIATGAITAVKIAAGTITGDKISGTTITGDKIAANTITATKIAAETITAAQIAANTITASNISAGTITGDKIAANAITANNIAADAITAGKIAAGVISATEIASGTITASKLAIGDFTNLIPDAGLMDAASWTLGSGFSLADSDGVFETTDRRLIWSGPATTGTGTLSIAESDFFVVDAKREYAVGGMFRSNTSGMSGRAFTAILWYDVDKVFIGSNFLPEHSLVNSQQKYSAIYTPPAGAVFARFSARRVFDAGGNVSGPCIWYHNFVRPAAAGELIVDGAITASKVAASAITADKIAAATITGDKIAANTISAGNIAAATITSAQIAAGTIQASNIATDTITSNKIAANAITASEIASGAVTAVKIAAATITGDKIAGTTITGDKIAANTITAAKITSGTITSSEIAAGTIQAFNIAAGTITGDKVAANAIAATNIAAGAITAVKIASATITGDKVAAGTITAGNIATNTITATEIAGETITGDKIAANTITAAQIAAGTITADQIAAGAITAGKISIGSFDNLNIDSNFDDTTAWSNPTGVDRITADAVGWGSSNLARLQGDSASYVVSTSKFSFELEPEGESLLLRYYARVVAGTGTVHVDLQLSKNPNFTGVSGTDFIPLGIGQVTSTSITKMEGRIVVPAGYRYGRIRLIKGDNGTTNCYIGGLMVRRMEAGRLIVDGTLLARHINTPDLVADLATINTAYIKDANISGTINAAKLTAGSALAATITVNGTALSTTTSRANDPAARINAAATQIDPGKIVISGATTLADWRKGGDETKIDGGNISANTITANKLEIGSRNITLTGITFEHNSPAANQVSWTAGTIRYINDAGVAASRSITAGSATWSSGVCYIYWTKDATTLSVTTVQATALGTNNVILATYEGGVKLDADYGRTIIDGSNIKTGTITANKINTPDLVADLATINTAYIKDANISGTLSAAKLTAGSALANSITVNGTALSTTTTRAADPAARINAATTQVSPGKIVISGATTLADWRKGGDETKIDGGNISANTITANAIAADAIVASKVLVHDRENLFPDGGFEEATGENWTLNGAGGTITFSTTTRSGGKSLSLNKSVLTNSVNIVSKPALYTHVREGDTYWAETEVRTDSGTATAGFYYRVRWYNASKTFISSTDIATNTGLNTTWAIFSKKVVAPANAAYAGVQLYNHSTNTVVGSFLIDRVVLRRANAAELIVDGTIQSDHINTGSFSAAGLALFGGAVQSSNFSAGSAGWQINKNGNAEFNSLIVRSSLVDGAVSDGVSSLALASQYTPSGVYLLNTALPGSIATYDSVYTIGLYFEHRVAGTRNSDGAPISTSYVLEERIKFLGVWSNWSNIYNSDYAPAFFGMSLGEPYTQKSFVTTKIFNAEAVEWRLKTYHSNGPVNVTQDCFRNASLTVKAVKR